MNSSSQSFGDSSEQGLGGLYQELILDHNRRPRNFGPLDDATHRAVGRNPLCGDHLQLALRLSADGQIDDIRFTGEGCAISRASASLMTAALKRQGRAEAERLFAAMHAMMTGADGCLVSARAGTRAGAKPEETEPRLAKLAALGGVRAFPARVKCATLAWHTLMAALDGGGRAAQTEV